MYTVFKSTKYFRNFVRYCSKKSSLGIIGIPFHKGQKKFGVNNAPAVLRQNGLIKSIENECLKIQDYGDLSYTMPEICVEDFKNMLNYTDFISCNRELTKKVMEILNKNNKMLVLGGDHSIAFGSVAGHLAYDPKIVLVWVDAHADINTYKTSPTGNIHGMPVSMILTELRCIWEKSKVEMLMKNYLSAKNIFYIGLRDLDVYEKFILPELKINAYGKDMVDKLGVKKIIEQILDKVDPKSKIHISFDIDGLDDKVAPSTGTPVSGGLTLEEGVEIVKILAETNRLQAFDLVEINPCIGSKNDIKQTIDAGIDLIKAAFGYNGK